MAPIVYLISGANRGIGLALTTDLSTRQNSIIFAGSRTTDRTDRTAALYALADAQPEKVIVVKLTSGNEEDNKAAVEVVRRRAGRLDVVIANAGIGRSLEPVLTESTDELRAHWDINVIGPHTLFKAVYPLLCLDSPRTTATDPPPRFVAISSTSGSVELGPTYSFLSYGASKAGLNYLMRKIHFEHEKDGLVSFPICPGAVDTDMWALVKTKDIEMTKAYTAHSLDEGAKIIMKIIDGATRESCGGKFVNHLGGVSPW